MKRSEMLTIISVAIIEAHFFEMIHGEGKSRPMTTDEIARIALKAIEDAGMFPPEHLFTSGERSDHYLQEWENE